MLEMIEQLREKANISYEEAKSVLEEADGDLLDAVILLEKRGKIKKPETEIMLRTETDEEPEKETVQEEQREGKAGPKAESKARNTLKRIGSILVNNSFSVTRKSETLFKMPAWAFALILFFFWETVIPIMLIALFFEVRYSFEGKDDLSSANRFMDQAGSFAGEVSGEFRSA